MNHPLNVPNLIVGGMGMLMGASLYLWARKHGHLLRGFTYRQFVWLTIIIIVGGAVTAFVQFFIWP